jgi:probable addiction module antidote protein
VRGRRHDKATELHHSTPAIALDAINGILEDGDQAELLRMLRQLTQAFGGVQAVAEQARLNPTQLYRTLSPKGNPALNSLTAILRAMGLRLAVQPLASSMLPMQLDAVLSTPMGRCGDAPGSTSRLARTCR